MSRFEVHSHSHYSNLRLLDCVNKPKDLINRAVKLGLKGLALTDHEALCRSSSNKFLSRRNRGRTSRF